MKKNIFSKLLLFVMIGGLVISCDEGGEPEAGATSTVEMSGDWFVQTFVGDDLVLDYQQISTYNTAADDGTQMWVDDHGHIWDFKVKSPINLDALTFSGETLSSNVDGYEVSVTITNGVIEKNGTTSTGGTTVDKISFDAEFSDDAGTIYSMIGYKRTGFPEDEH
ncbi:lipid-binding protein [uncultured Kriegella sp.]|uniref:lipid-binding protein n=1 Tax=uncultured Kriegella sp. TaxID=1798910 RepID=UPI0030DBC9DD|tara:strand:+ start:11356 stop:11850 length:495 start_codon:yes stop_codon:yes gene_type:complete